MNNQPEEFIGYIDRKRYELRREDCLGVQGTCLTNNLEALKKQKRYIEKVTKQKYYIYDLVKNTIVNVDKPRRKKSSKSSVLSKSDDKYGVNSCFL